MENKGDHFEILKTGEICSLQKKLCKLKHSGKHLKESLEAQKRMSSDKSQYVRQTVQPQKRKKQNENEKDGYLKTIKKIFGFEI